MLQLLLLILLTLLIKPVDTIDLDAGVDRALRYYEAEPRSRVFNDLAGANEFIKKFNLSPAEISVIGNWMRNGLIEEESDYKNGIGYGLALLPNRIFIADDSRERRDKDRNYLGGNRYEKIGLWRVVNNKLEIKPMYIYDRDLKNEPFTNSVKTSLDCPYYPIWDVKIHSKAFAQGSRFYFNNIPSEIKKQFLVQDKDVYRVRYLIPLGFDGSYDDLFAKDKPWHDFLLNPKIDEEWYDYALRAMYTGGPDSGRYDFKKNIFNLRFSK